MPERSTKQPPSLPPEAELEESFLTAGGPGGQHVNKTATAVQLRFDVASTSFLDTAVKRRLLKLAGRRADSAGVITIVARSHRSQHRNREEARRRLAGLIAEARKTPRRRIPTRPTKSAKKKRLQQKRHAGRIKRLRRGPGPEE